MTERQQINILGKESIVVGNNITDFIIQSILENIPSSTYVIITDTNVGRIHLKKYEEAFESAPQKLRNRSRLLTYLIPAGETSKSRQVKSEIEDFMLEAGCTRDSCILALGGGVVGDLSGFVAATFMRGIPFVQIPTTLLAMVDSSIGGKTAIDTSHGKNLIGSFWQPKYVFVDISFLSTLPSREFYNGMAEIIKSFLIWNSEEFDLLESSSHHILNAMTNNPISSSRDHQVLIRMITSAIQVKAHIVSCDEKESGLRSILNFGHSIGHAIEAIYAPRILHGECIAIGMVLEAEISRSMGHITQGVISRITRCLKSFNLPIGFTDTNFTKHVAVQTHSAKQIMEFMQLDKKNLGDRKRIVLLKRIGETVDQNASFVSNDLIFKTLTPCVVVHPTTPSPKHEVQVAVPGSKSISNRALILAFLASGITRLHNLLHSDDTIVMLEALKLLGGRFSWENNGTILTIYGSAGDLYATKQDIYLGNAGTAVRFLTSLATIVKPSQLSQSTILTGNERMQERPIGSLVDALRSNGCDITYLKKPDCVPLEISSLTGLRGGLIRLSASISSQYVSSILLCAPYAQAPITLKLVGDDVVSQPYIDMTIAMMNSFGVHVDRIDKYTYHIPQAVYSAPSDYTIESDASSATYPLAVAAITGSTCTIPNIGSNSIQGDAGFAINVLKPMGCHVQQTPHSTTVTGPPIGTLQPLPNIDMESMTDAFLTASVLAAVTHSGTGENITRIRGISNQRVKECNRILAMVTQLVKFGVKANELPDGIEIHGNDLNTLRAPTDGVFCYDDHRVAMSFSVLATIIRNGTLIQQKRCVEKTWPTWWDCLHDRMNISVEGCETNLHPSSLEESTATPLVFIGMRGVGKTTYAKALARILNSNFIDLDAHFEQAHKTSVNSFIQAHSWTAFRQQESILLSQLIQDTPSGDIISCGGGVVESSSSRETLKRFIDRGGIVIHIKRDLSEITKSLSKDSFRIPCSQSFESTWNSRKTWYEECSSHEYYIEPTSNLTRSIQLFRNFILSLRKKSPIPANFLSLTVESPLAFKDDLLEACTGAAAIELRVDLMTSYGDPSRLLKEVTFVRNQTQLPIIFTVRTKRHGGDFPNDKIHELLQLIRLAFRFGCEFVDIEIDLPIHELKSLFEKRRTSQIIASWHDASSGTKWLGSDILSLVHHADSYGDIIKLVGHARGIHDNLALESFKTSIQSKFKKPLIAINMGREGALSRVLNSTMNPVTHPGLPVTAAPGQMTILEINKVRSLLSIQKQCNFYLFGFPIRHSFSPLIHNSIFEYFNLPHQYHLSESESLDVPVSLMKRPDFGGASVTMPLKLKLIPFLDEISDAARLIGAVNTITPFDQNGQIKLFGDNTDYLAIKQCLMDSISLDTPALIIGAGGTARAALYALLEIGLSHVFIYNRTYSKACQLSTSFPFKSYPVSDLEEIPVSIGLVISTIPANTFSLNLKRLNLSAKGVALDMAYVPRITPLEKESQALGWDFVSGIELLLSQAFYQSKLFLGISPPSHYVRKRVLSEFTSRE